MVIAMSGKVSGEIIVYQSDDGLTYVDVRFGGNNIWLTQAQLIVIWKCFSLNALFICVCKVSEKKRKKETLSAFCFFLSVNYNYLRYQHPTSDNQQQGFVRLGIGHRASKFRFLSQEKLVEIA